LHAIEARTFVQAHRLDTLTGAPVTITVPGHISSTSIWKRLEEIGVLTRAGVRSLGLRLPYVSVAA